MLSSLRLRDLPLEGEHRCVFVHSHCVMSWWDPYQSRQGPSSQLASWWQLVMHLVPCTMHRASDQTSSLAILGVTGAELRQA